MANIKQKSKEKKGLVINTLIVRKLNRNVLDVGQWRTALKAADNDRRQKLYNLYEDILLDPVLSNAVMKRINAITNADIVFMKDDKTVEEIDDMIDSPVMEDILTEIMNSRFWGKTVIELDFTDGLDAYNIPRQHIRPEKGIITINPGDEQGVEYRGDDFFLEAGKDKDFGLLLKAAPYAIFKRGGGSDWAQFCELFGIPMKVGKYSAQDEESRKALQEAFDESGGTSWLTAPKETDIEIKESTTRGDGNLFNNFRKACNEEILISILGQTMTTVDGSSRAQSQVHKDVEEDVNKADRRFVQRILNTELLPRLEKRGFPVKGGWFSFPDAAETISKTDQISIHDKFINKLGLNIDEDFLYDFYGVPKPKDGQTKREPQKTEPPKTRKKDTKKESGNKLIEPETSFWTRLREGISDFFALAPIRGAAGNLPGDLPIDASLSSIPVFDIDNLAKRIAGGTDYFDPQLYHYTSDTLLNALWSGFAQHNFSIGIDYGYTPDALKTAMEINLFHFSAAKTLAEVQQLNEAFRLSTGWPDFRRRAREISGEFNETWLRTEYDTAYLTAESSAAYYRLISQADIFPYWQYVTMNDGKVREEHIMLHGLVLACTDHLWEKIYPPNGWRCRCRVKPLMRHEAKDIDFRKEHKKVDEFFGTKEWKNARAQGWGVNRALTAEVFDANQMYIRKFPAKSASYLRKLTSDKWGLRSVPKLKEAAKTNAPVFTGTAEGVWQQENVDGIIKLNIYDGRTLEIDNRKFNVHTSKRDNRISLWTALKDTLMNPDEIWLNDYTSNRFDNINIIKYYRDKVIVANYKVEKKKLVLKTWYEMQTVQGKNKADLKKDIWDKRRRGLLIKKPGS